MDKKQKILILSAAALSLVFGVFVLLKINSANEPVKPPIETSPTSTAGEGVFLSTTYNEEGLPVINTPKETKVSILKLSDEDKKVFDYWINKETGNIYYLSQEGKVFSAKEGPDLNISSQEIGALNYIQPSPSGKMALVAFGDPKKPSWGLFDAVDQAWRPVNGRVVLATWGDDDDSLIALIDNKTENILARLKTENATTQTEKLNFKTIAHNFNFLDIKIRYTGDNRLLIIEKPNANYKSRIWQFNLKTKQLSLLTENKGLYLNLNPKIVFKFIAPDLFNFTDSQLIKNDKAPFFTMPDKCGSDQNNIYCFVPEKIPANLTLPDDYFKRKFYTKDNLQIVSLDNYQPIKTMVAEKDIPLTDSTMVKTDDKNNLYFINRYNWALYKIKLPQLNLNSPAEENKTATSSTSTVAD